MDEGAQSDEKLCAPLFIMGRKCYLCLSKDQYTWLMKTMDLNAYQDELIRDILATDYLEVLQAKTLKVNFFLIPYYSKYQTSK